MVKCTKKQIRRLKTALHWKGHPEQRQRIQMVLLRESGMTQPAIAEAMGVSLSTVNRAHMAYDHGGLKALRRKPSGGRKRENMGPKRHARPARPRTRDRARHHVPRVRTLHDPVRRELSQAHLLDQLHAAGMACNTRELGCG